jgi:hypothetical protein
LQDICKHVKAAPYPQDKARQTRTNWLHFATSRGKTEMKNYCRKVFSACVLLLVLTCSTFADDGVMHTDRTPPPPPPPSASGVIQTGLNDGVMHTDIAAPDTVTEIALGLLQNLLVLF